MDKIQEIIELLDSGSKTTSLKDKYTGGDLTTARATQMINSNNFEKLKSDTKVIIRSFMNEESVAHVAKKLNKKTSSLYPYKKVLQYCDLSKISINIKESNTQLKEAGLTDTQIKEINPGIKRAYNKKPKLEQSTVKVEPVTEYFKITVNETEVNIKTGTKGIFISNEGIFIKN